MWTNGRKVNAFLMIGELVMPPVPCRICQQPINAPGRKQVVHAGECKAENDRNSKRRSDRRKAAKKAKGL